MANNRMWLIHKPSKLGIMLGKRLAWGWYSPPETSHFEKFYNYLKGFDYLTFGGGQDDFVLAMEDCTESKLFDEWKYTSKFVNGFRLFSFNKGRQKRWIKKDIHRAYRD